MGLGATDFRQAADDVDYASDLVAKLKDLAQWVIRDDALRRAARFLNEPVDSPPSIRVESKRPGACLLPLVGTPGQRSILSEGFLLPVHWRSGGEHDLRLPQSLRETADEVLRVLDVPDCSIHLILPGQRGPSEPFLADVTDGMSSTFAPLAGGLRMLQKGTSPDFLTISTGQNIHGRISQVSHVREKTEAVLNFPPRDENKRFRNWFVPAERNSSEALEAIKQTRSAGQGSSDSELTVRVFSESGDVDQQLNSLLACSGMRPDPRSSFAALQDYYQWVMEFDHEYADEYYKEVLYQQILERGFVGGTPTEARPTHFVAVVSTPAIIGLAHRLFRFKRALILHTIAAKASQAHSMRADFSRQANDAKDLIEADGCDGVQVESFAYRPELAGPELWKSIRTAFEPHLDSFLAQVPAGNVMWDMTSGLRIFSHVLEKSFARPGDWMLAINQQWAPRQGVRIPCTETLAIWKHGVPI